jgi:hypothetical protein
MRVIFNLSTRVAVLWVFEIIEPDTVSPVGLQWDAHDFIQWDAHDFIQWDAHDFMRFIHLQNLLDSMIHLLLPV